MGLRTRKCSVGFVIRVLLACITADYKVRGYARFSEKNLKTRKPGSSPGFLNYLYFNTLP